MRGLHSGLTDVYNASSCVIIPGGGSYATEAVGRQSLPATKKRWWCAMAGLSYRWTQIFDQGVRPAHAEIVSVHSLIVPMQINSSALHRLMTLLPEFMTKNRVWSSAPMLKLLLACSCGTTVFSAIAQAAHDVGALFVLDCVASGTLWVDMKDIGVDVLITAPQKGWTSTPCAGVVMMSDAAVDRLQDTDSDSFVLDLKKWHQIMTAYLNGGHAYHATMPTDGLAQFYDTMLEMKAFGFARAKEAQVLNSGTVLRQIMEHARL